MKTVMILCAVALPTLAMVSCTAAEMEDYNSVLDAARLIKAVS